MFEPFLTTDIKNVYVCTLYIISLLIKVILSIITCSFLFMSVTGTYILKGERGVQAYNFGKFDFEI